MSTLREALDDYLTIRRQLGFKLENPGRLLAQLSGSSSSQARAR